MTRSSFDGKKKPCFKSGLVLSEAISISDESSLMRHIDVYEMLQHFLCRVDLVSKSGLVLCELEL